MAVINEINIEWFTNVLSPGSDIKPVAVRLAGRLPFAKTTIVLVANANLSCVNVSAWHANTRAYVFCKHYF